MNDLRAAVDRLHGLPPSSALWHDVKLLLDAYNELNNAICWDTSCLNCASLLDASYESWEKLDRIKRIVNG
jgi:hypothetical protein